MDGQIIPNNEVLIFLRKHWRQVELDLKYLDGETTLSSSIINNSEGTARKRLHQGEQRRSILHRITLVHVLNSTEIHKSSLHCKQNPHKTQINTTQLKSRALAKHRWHESNLNSRKQRAASASSLPMFREEASRRLAKGS